MTAITPPAPNTSVAYESRVAIRESTILAGSPCRPRARSASLILAPKSATRRREYLRHGPEVWTEISSVLPADKCTEALRCLLKDLDRYFGYSILVFGFHLTQRECARA